MNGTIDTTVTKQWQNRPEDQRFLTLDELAAAVKYTDDNSREIRARVKDLSCIMNDDCDDIRLEIRQAKEPAILTHHSFGGLCARVGAPANYLRSLPVELAAENLNHGIQTATNDAIMPYIFENGHTTLRASTSQTYGRIYDTEVVAAIKNLVARNGVNWKVPGTLNWATDKHNPHVDVTKENTTLYASDRDVFVFLVDDENPIEVGKLENGEPDLMFRGFYAWNSEVGAATFGLATMYMRAVCQNRILWGVENRRELKFRHTAGAPDRFLHEVRPALIEYAHHNSGRLIAGVNEAKRPILPDERGDKVKWIMKEAGITQSQAAGVLNTVEREEGRICRSAWDVAQGLTAMARRIPHQDQRVKMERAAKTILDAVAVA